MMTFVSVVLTIALVFDCLLLMLLVLIQLPKKDAGAGLAFGGGATDALFGAGAGNTLTKITKWTAGIFFGLSLTLSVLNTYAARTGSELKNAISKPGATAPITPNAPGPLAPPSKPAVAPTNAEIPLISTTNIPAAPILGTNATTNIPIIPPK